MHVVAAVPMGYPVLNGPASQCEVVVCAGKPALAFVLVTTDACFRSQEALPALPIALLISYDLPTRKVL